MSRHRHRLTLFEHLVLIATLIGGLMAIRSVSWFALAALMFLPALVDEAIKDRVQKATLNHRAIVWIGRVMIPVVALVGLTAALRPAEALERSYPREAADVVGAAVAEDPSLKVFASDRYADWLLWREPTLAG